MQGWKLLYIHFWETKCFTPQEETCSEHLLPIIQKQKPLLIYTVNDNYTIYSHMFHPLATDVQRTDTCGVLVQNIGTEQPETASFSHQYWKYDMHQTAKRCQHVFTSLSWTRGVIEMMLPTGYCIPRPSLLYTSTQTTQVLGSPKLSWSPPQWSVTLMS